MKGYFFVGWFCQNSWHMICLFLFLFPGFKMFICGSCTWGRKYILNKWIGDTHSHTINPPIYLKPSFYGLYIHSMITAFSNKWDGWFILFCIHFSSGSFRVKALKLVASYECINNIIIIMVIIINAIEILLYVRHHPKSFMKIISFNSYNHSRKYLHLTDKETSLYR